MKKLIKLLCVMSALSLFVIGCSSDDKTDNTDYSGTYTGYSWKGEIEGVAFEDASQYIETTITLDKKGVITDFKMDFVKVGDDGTKTYRNNPDAEVTTNFDVESGSSMFDIKTADKMSLYVVDVNDKGEVAFGIVDPMTRYLFETKLAADYDFNNKTFKDLTVDNGFIPTTLTSSSGMIKEDGLDALKDKSLLEFHEFSYVIGKRGTFKDLTNDTTVKEMLEMAGVTFEGDKPVSVTSNYGFHSNGGWSGNYNAIKENLIGKSALDVNELASFTGKTYLTEKNYQDSINEDNFFGVNVDTVSTATKTIQNSYDTFTGATVRISRENTSFQRALVEAGIIKEEDVIKGRF